MIWDIVRDVSGESLEVCVFVVLMMSLVEALNLGADTPFFKKFRKSGIGQVGLGAVIGAIPGCVGGFAVTSLYNKGMVSFGALVAMMIASSGDEAFVMLSMFPKTAVCIIAGLMCLAFVAGLAVDALKIQVRRVETADDVSDPACEHAHCHHHGHKHKGVKAFLVDNIWHHVVVRHLPKVFAWTFGVMFAMALLERYVDASTWISDNTVLMILLAALIGIIPESGPHLIFVTLFASGILPLPVLMASCVAQDGHSGLALLADNRRSFFAGKLINVIIAIAVGLTAMQFV